jgi:hypothetical protein
MDVRWYYMLSPWIFLLSATVLVHGQPMYPLQLLALIGCAYSVLTPWPQPLLKHVLIQALHLLPFLWLSPILNEKGITFGLLVIIVWLLFMIVIGKNPIAVYRRFIEERHATTYDFVKEQLNL